MKCPACGHDDTQVKDSRPVEDGAGIRRRRQCPKCDHRFTTFERVQVRELTVIKSDGTRRPFDREKIVYSMEIATRKRNISADIIALNVNGIVQTLEGRGDTEIPAKDIGILVMDVLQSLDQVAYIRYASVYRNFHEASDFSDFMKRMEN